AVALTQSVCVTIFEGMCELHHTQRENLRSVGACCAFKTAYKSARLALKRNFNYPMRFFAAQRLGADCAFISTSVRCGMNPSLSIAKGSVMQPAVEPPQLVWGAPSAAERGPVIATLRNAAHRNAVGSHAGGYSVYRALAIAARTLAHDHIADLT